MLESVPQALVAAAGAVVALGTVGGGFVWLVWPRIEDKIEEVARGVRRVEAATSGDHPESLHRYAHVAATRSAEIPEIASRLEKLVAAHQDLIEWQDQTDGRITKLEHQYVELLGQLADLLTREVRTIKGIDESMNTRGAQHGR